MKSVVPVAAICALALAAGIGWWLWWPPRPEEPGFFRLDLAEVRLWARPEEVEVQGMELRVTAPKSVIWLESSRRLGPVLFQVRGRPARVEVSSRSSRTEHRLPSSGADRSLFLEWQPGEPRRYRSRPDRFYYRLVVSFPKGSGAGSGIGQAPSLAFLGTRELLDRDYYGVEWRACGTPETVRVGEELPVLARATNTSPYVWPHRGNARVRLAGRWLREDGPVGEVLADLEAPVEPGSELARWLRPRAPESSGRHTLELDLAYEPLASFSEKGAPTCRAVVTVE